MAGLGRNYYKGCCGQCFLPVGIISCVVGRWSIVQKFDGSVLVLCGVIGCVGDDSVAKCGFFL